MRKLWQDIQAHKRAAVLYLVYWLATLTVSFITWAAGNPGWVVGLLFTNPFIVGAMVGRWRAANPERVFRWGDVIRGGMLAGVLSTTVTFVVMKGGVVEELIIRMHGHKFELDQVLVFWIICGILGAVLGVAGAAVAIIVDRRRRPISST